MDLDTNPPDAGAATSAAAARVVQTFFRDGRLVSIPARQGKRLFVLRELRERCFSEDRDYPEKEVNMRLALVHPDVAALRRYLVESGLMSRSNGIYRRLPGNGG